MDMNLLLRILTLIFFIVFLFVVVGVMSGRLDVTIKENSATPQAMLLLLLSYLMLVSIVRMPTPPMLKGMTEMSKKLLILGVVILVVAGLSIILYISITGNIPSFLNIFILRVFPF